MHRWPHCPGSAAHEPDESHFLLVSALFLGLACMSDLHIWAPLLMTLGSLILIFQGFPRQSKYGRVLAAILCGALWARYLYWRIFFTFPSHQNILQQIWAGCFLWMEACTVVSY